MDIKYIGHSSFVIKSKSAQVVTDPFDPKMVGLKFPKQEADIVTISHHHPDHDYLAGVGGSPLVIDWPGDYEKMGVRITGFKSFHDKKKGADRGENILYKFETEEMSILHCGDLGLVPDDSFVQELGDINVLLVPVGGFYTIDPTDAVEFIKKLEPNMVVPMHYRSPAHEVKAFAQLATLEDFLKKMGITPEEPMPKLSIKKENIMEDEMKVVVLKAES